MKTVLNDGSGRTRRTASACLVVMFAVGGVGGCSEPGGGWQNRGETRGGSVATESRSDQIANRVVAEVDGEAVTMSELWSGMAEGGGVAALEEWVLDRGLGRLAEARGVTISQEEIERERRALVTALAGEVGADESLSDQALSRVRVARGLGPKRFGALLERTAKMRALVRGDVPVSDEEIAAEVELAIGSKVTAVVSMFATEKEAALVRAGLEESTEARIERLSAIARGRSIDPSAGNGGVVGPIHPKDPRVPGSLRSVMETLAVGELSPVMATDGGFVVMMIASRTERGPQTPAVEAASRASLVARKERVAMDGLARGVLSRASVNVIDESLRWSWQRARRGEN